MKKLKALLLILSLSINFIPAKASGREAGSRPEILTISSVENDFIHTVIKEIIQAAYEKAGIKVKFYDLPPMRALEWANAGKTDGDLARIDGTEKKYTNLIKISTPLLELKNAVFTRNIARDVRSIEDLKGLAIGIRSGIRISDISTAGLERIMAKDLPHLFRLLSTGRIDVAIADYNTGRIELNKNFKGSGIHIIGRTLGSAWLYHFINKKNTDLVAKLESAFKAMALSGELVSIREKTIREMLSE